MSLNLPKHNFFSLTHCPNKQHKCSVKELIRRDKWDANVWVTPECRQKAIDTNNVWIAIWDDPKDGEYCFLASNDINLILKELDDLAKAEEIMAGGMGMESK